jgi:hypothetical protein
VTRSISIPDPHYRRPPKAPTVIQKNNSIPKRTDSSDLSTAGCLKNEDHLLTWQNASNGHFHVERIDIHAATLLSVTVDNGLPPRDSGP